MSCLWLKIGYGGSIYITKNSACYKLGPGRDILWTRKYPRTKEETTFMGGAICLLCVKPTLALDRTVEMKLLHAQWVGY